MSKRKLRTKTSIAVCTRSRREKQNTDDLPILPMDVMFNILSRIPAEFLHNDVKYVSKAWANIICDPLFIKMQLLHISNDVGLLIQDNDKPWRIRYLEAKEGKIKDAPPKYHVPGRLPLASYEGITLLEPNKDYLYVGNCVTKQGLRLPCHRFPTCKGLGGSWSGLSRISQSGELKVIFSCEGFDGLRHWHILTVGTDTSWRKIDCNFTKDEFESMSVYSISINEIIYWPRRGIRDIKFPAVDLSDESIHWIQVPEEFWSPGRRIPFDDPSTYGLLKMGNYLSCILVSNTNHMEMNVWILKDMLSSTWVKILTFEFNVGLKVPKVFTYRGYYTRIAWLDNGRVLVFSRCQGRHKPCKYVIYNLTTSKLRYISNVCACCKFLVVDHISTLVSL